MSIQHLGKFLEISSLGIGLTVSSSATILVPGLVGERREDITSLDSGAWESFFTGKITARRYDSKGVYVSSTIYNREIKYYLYDLKEEFNETFSLPFEMREEEYSQIPQEKIKVFLFESPAWKNGSEDRFRPLTEDQVNQLFSSVEEKYHNKVKELLLKLSMGRRWKIWSTRYNSYWDENDYRSINYLQKPKNEGFEAKIKYFIDFEDFKNYISEKVKACGESSNCSPSKDDTRIRILLQDKKDFFEIKVEDGDVIYPKTN